jgi:hypothetical protein
VRSTVSGAALGTVSPPSGQTVMAVTAAADDGEFMLDTQPFVSASSNANQNFEPRTFREVRLGPDGSVASLSKLAVSVPGGQLMTGFALSPDGGRLAIAVQPGNNKQEPDLTEVKVITLATGATLTWTANGTIGTDADDARSLSWTSNERTLAFTWTAGGPGVHTGLWLLDVTNGGGSLLAHSREAVTLLNLGAANATPLPTGGSALVLHPASTSAARPVAPPQCQLDSIITPDGSTLVCGGLVTVDQRIEPPNEGGLQRGAETEFFEYSTASGRVTRVLGYWKFGSVGVLEVDVLWSNASGSLLIGVIPDSGYGRIGVISGNEFTPLPTAGLAVASTVPVYGVW